MNETIRRKMYTLHDLRRPFITVHYWKLSQNAI